MTTVNKTRHPRLLSLCSGIGGIDLAWEMAGGEIAGQCELDDYCQRVLARHWPEVKRVSDIRSVWGDSFDGPIDLVAGGIPCQPWSVAGKRRGHADDRHLWPEMRRIVAIYQPAWVLIENVAGFARLALDGVLTDLGADGYEASAIMVPAAATGAPHLRERVFVVAHRDDDCGRWAQRAERRDVADAHSQRWAQGDAAKRDAARQSDCRAAEGAGAMADAAVARLPQRRRSERDTCDAQAGAGLESKSQRCGAVEHASGAGRQERDVSRVACDTGHPAWRSAEVGRSGQPESRVVRDADGLSRRLDGAGLIPPRHAWPALRGEAQHKWEPPRTTTERIPNRAARLKALGNSVVPQQIYPILAAIITVWRVDCR